MSSNFTKKNSEKDFYDSLEEWQAKNFPNIQKKKGRSKSEKNLEALGATIADNISRKIKFRLKDSET